MTDKKNYYSVPKGYLLDPFQHLYLNNDFEPSEDPVIREVIEYARGLEEKIEGDFNLDYVRFQFGYNTLAFIRNGLLAFKIKSLKLYKKTHSSFKRYCKEVIGRSHWQINKLVEAARVAMELIYAGFDVIPSNPSQCAPLAGYTGEELIEKWQSILDNFREDKITAQKIYNFLHPATAQEELDTRVTLPVKLYTSLLELAIARGQSLVGTIEQLFYERVQIDNFSEAIFPDKMKAWQEDLRDLTGNI